MSALRTSVAAQSRRSQAACVLAPTRTHRYFAFSLDNSNSIAVHCISVTLTAHVRFHQYLAFSLTQQRFYRYCVPHLSASHSARLSVHLMARVCFHQYLILLRFWSLHTQKPSSLERQRFYCYCLLQISASQCISRRASFSAGEGCFSSRLNRSRSIAGPRSPAPSAFWSLWPWWLLPL